MLTLHTRVRHQKKLKSNDGKYLYEIEQKNMAIYLLESVLLRNLSYTVCITLNDGKHEKKEDLSIHDE